MRKYETTFIIDGTLSDENREAIIGRYEKSLTDKGAEFSRTVRWGKRQLAYPIRKRTRGYYVIFYYDAEPENINPFHRELDIDERILRYLTILSEDKHPDYIRDEGTSSIEKPVVEKSPSIKTDEPVDSEDEEIESEDVSSEDEKETEPTTEVDDDTPDDVKPAEESSGDDQEEKTDQDKEAE